MPAKTQYPLTFAETVEIQMVDHFCSGLTKREMFAMAAMQGILANSSNSMSYAARDAVLMADELLSELELTK